MTTKCDPCECPEQYYRDTEQWRKAVIELLCDVEQALIQGGGQGTGTDPCAQITTVADGSLYVCNNGVMHPLTGNAGDLLALTNPLNGAVAFQPSAASAFTWSNTEQIWPFEKALGGVTVYAKEVDLGTFPNTNTKTVAHGIAGFTLANLFKFEGYAHSAGGGFSLSDAYPTAVFSISLRVSATDFIITTATDYTDTSGVGRIYYTK